MNSSTENIRLAIPGIGLHRATIPRYISVEGSPEQSFARGSSASGGIPSQTSLRSSSVRTGQLILVIFAAILTVQGSALGQEMQQGEMAEAAPVQEGEETPAAKLLAASTKEEYDAASDQYWYLIVGPANVWPRLEESSSEIDRDINGLLGNLIPGYNKPTTFADWRDSVMLWDVHTGIGRSLSDKWAVFGTAGIIFGTINNEDSYLFPVPMDVDIKFHRKVWFLSAGVDYHPWGKARMLPENEGTALTRRLRGARPYFEAGIGYVNVYTVGQVKISVPLFGDIGKIKHAEYYDLFYLSPRVGVDIPITDRTTGSFQAGYLFFNRHPDEFNCLSLYFLVKHRL